MPKFSIKSEQELNLCHPDLRKLFNEVIKNYDCTILAGARSDADQKKAFAAGNSKLDGVVKKSKHQVDKENPYSRAVDASPYPYTTNREQLSHFAGYVEGIAEKLNIKIRWGGDWDGDNNLANNKFDDLYHFELL